MNHFQILKALANGLMDQKMQMDQKGTIKEEEIEKILKNCLKRIKVLKRLENEEKEEAGYLVVIFVTRLANSFETVYNAVLQLAMAYFEKEINLEESVKFVLLSNILTRIRQKAEDSSENVILGLSCIKVVLERISKQEYNKIIPGLGSFLLKGINLEFNQKKNFVKNLLEVAEKFFELFFKYNQDRLSSIDEENKKIQETALFQEISLMNSNFEIWKGKIQKPQNGSNNQEMRSVRKLVQELDHVLVIIDKNFEFFLKIHLKHFFFKFLIKMFEIVFEYKLKLHVTHMTRLLIKFGGIGQDNSPEQSFSILDKIPENLDSEIIDAEIEKIGEGLKNFDRLVSKEQKLAFLGKIYFLKKLKKNFSFNFDFFSFFKFSEVDVSSFVLCSSDHYYLDYEQILNLSLLEVDGTVVKKNIKQKIDKELKENLNNCNFDEEVIKIQEEVIKEGYSHECALLNELLIFFNSVLDFYKKILTKKKKLKKNRKNEESIEIFANNLRRYEKVSKFIQDMVTLFRNLYILSEDEKNFSKKKFFGFFESIYKGLLQMDYLEKFLSLFQSESATKKTGSLRILTILRIKTILNIFGILWKFDFKGFKRSSNLVMVSMIVLEVMESEDKLIKSLAFSGLMVIYSEVVKEKKDFCKFLQKLKIEQEATTMADVVNSLYPSLLQGIEYQILNDCDKSELVAKLKIIFSLSEISLFAKKRKIENFLSMTIRIITLLQIFLSSHIIAELGGMDLLTNSKTFQKLILKIFRNNLIFLKENLKQLKKNCEEKIEKNKMPVSNVIRNLFLKLCPLVRSKFGDVVNLFFGFAAELVFVFKDVPLLPEREREEFSMNDAQNVTIPEALGPLMYEIWPDLVLVAREMVLGEVGADELGSKLLEYPKSFSKSREIHLDGRLRAYLRDAQPDEEVELKFEILKENIKNLENMLKPFLPFPKKRYLESSLLSLSAFLVKLNSQHESFLKISQKFKKDFFALIWLYILAKELRTINSLKITINFIKVSNCLDNNSKQKQILIFLLKNLFKLKNTKKLKKDNSALFTKYLETLEAMASSYCTNMGSGGENNEEEGRI